MKLPDITQPTTQRGLVAMLALIAARFDPEYRDQIIDVGIFIYSWMLMLVDENG